MNKSSRDFLNELLETPSPTGFEERIQAVVKKRMKPYADSMDIDLHGNLIVGLNTKASRKIMLAGHCDQIGFMVNHVNKEGFIYVSALGGIDPGVLPGSRVTIHSASGPITGIFGRKPIHQQGGDERGSMKLDLGKMWIDIGAQSKKEVEKKITIGDPVTFQLGAIDLGNNLISSPGLDDKVGLFITMEALRLCSESKIAVGLYAVSTVQEEIGVRGATTSAYRIQPEVGIAIDVTTASDSPATEDGKAIPCKLGGGPSIVRGPNVNPVVGRMLVQAAKKAKLPYQHSLAGGVLANDARAIQVTGTGVATGSLGIPNRYMHTQVEVCSLDDLENTAKLLAAFVKSIGPKTDFRPGS